MAQDDSNIEENRRLKIALGTVLAMFGGVFVASVVPAATSKTPESVSVSEANDEFKSKLADAATEELDPEVEKILYPYRKSAEEPAMTVAQVETTPPEASEPTEIVATTTLKPPIEAESPPTLSESPAVENTAMTELETADLTDTDASESEPTAEFTPIDTGAAYEEPSTAELAISVDASAAPEATELDSSDKVATKEPMDLLIEPSEPATAASAPTSEPVVIVPPAPPIAAENSDPEPASPPISNVVPTVSEEPTPLVDALIDADTVTAEPQAVEEAIDAVVEQVVESEVSAVAEPKTVQPKPGRLAKKPFLGVGIRDTSNTVVTTLYSGSTATNLGVVLGDEIVALNDQPVTNMETVQSALRQLAVGDNLAIKIKRGGETLTLGPLPLGSK